MSRVGAEYYTNCYQNVASGLYFGDYHGARIDLMDRQRWLYGVSCGKERSKVESRTQPIQDSHREKGDSLPPTIINTCRIWRETKREAHTEYI